MYFLDRQYKSAKGLKSTEEGQSAVLKHVSSYRSCLRDSSFPVLPKLHLAHLPVNSKQVNNALTVFSGLMETLTSWPCLLQVITSALKPQNGYQLEKGWANVFSFLPCVHKWSKVKYTD